MPDVATGADDQHRRPGLTSGESVLGGRYELVRRLVDSDGVSEQWLAIGAFETPHLVKVWPYSSEEPDDVTRALWDAELRTLYRIGSSPGAEETVLVLRDAGVDRESRCFVMVLRTTGFVTLADALQGNTQQRWLPDRGPRGRREIWSALELLVDGLRLLHDQQVIHRNVRAETVFFDEHLALPSMRLGGFEWSVRLGVPVNTDPPASWSTPPERLQGPVAFRPEGDWFGFGMLAARCLLDVENYDTNDPALRHERVATVVARATTTLTQLERGLLGRLIAHDPRHRLDDGDVVSQRIGEIVAALQDGVDASTADRPYVLVIDPNNIEFVDAAEAVGFRPDPDDPLAPYQPQNPGHTAALRNFVRRDLDGGQIHAVGVQTRHLLVGEQLTVTLRPWTHVDKPTGTEVTTYRAMFAGVGTSLRVREGAAASTTLRAGRLTISTPREMNQRGRDGTQWDLVLPRVDRVAQVRANLQRFQELVSCMNQIELLLRDAELFAFRTVDRPDASLGFEEVVIEQLPREREPVDFARVQGGMAEFLQQELESNKPKSQKVILGEQHEDFLSVAWVNEPSQWDIVAISPGTGHVHLRRAISAEAPKAPDEGILRTHGFFGQISLIKRRKRAIDRLRSHSYLLRSLSAPAQVHMDTGPSEPRVFLDPNVVDKPKRDAISDILRTRPIYTLQGPPGTGKTTLVAWLVREIIEDDPVAQILVTAQAHGAVDVLREKVRTEAFAGVAEDKQPLAVRLGRAPTGEHDDLDVAIPSRDPSTVEGVALRVLEGAAEALSDGHLSEVQQHWKDAIGQMVAALQTAASESGAPDFCELVKRGAHLTYCTTSAGELEALADMTQSFDWSILEEAGKAHSFDLALPLQAGHRWLLIGDQRQLPPHRDEDYSKAIENLEAVAVALQELPAGGAGLVDLDWIRSWRQSTPEEKIEFTAYVRRWRKTFSQIYEQCDQATNTDDPDAVRSAGMITGQHRMHPTIGELISETYYKGELRNATVDPATGRIHPKVVHPYIAPDGIAGRAVVWLDVPWTSNGGEHEIGPAQGLPRYTNPAEVEALKRFFAALRRKDDSEPLDVAVLSPYNRQVNLINKSRVRDTVPDGLALRPTHRRRTGDPDTRVAHTVDSFQGNQAAIIAVSLVRNNGMPAGAGLGFLAEPARVNVLLSRAEQLLVLVGSFEFFCHQVQYVDLDDTEDTLWHWRKVVTLLQGWFVDGRAALIPVSDL